MRCRVKKKKFGAWSLAAIHPHAQAQNTRDISTGCSFAWHKPPSGLHILMFIALLLAMDMGLALAFGATT